MTNTLLNLGPIERDELYDSDYIPLPGGWAIKLLNDKDANLYVIDPLGLNIGLPKHYAATRTIERMARDIHAACVATPVAWQYRSHITGRVGEPESEWLNVPQHVVEIMAEKGYETRALCVMPLPEPPK